MRPPKLPDASSQYGASMGRRSSNLDPDFAYKLHLYKMPMVDGDYDQGGAYWGMGPESEPMWHAYGDGLDEVVDVFLRAWDREQAKDVLREMCPKARFYR